MHQRDSIRSRIQLIGIRGKFHFENDLLEAAGGIPSRSRRSAPMAGSVSVY